MMITTTITTLTKIKRGKKVNSVEFDVALTINGKIDHLKGVQLSATNRDHF